MSKAKPAREQLPRTVPPEPGLVQKPALGLLITVAAVWAFWHLDLRFSELFLFEGGWRVAGEFFARALSPALAYESPDVPAGSSPLLWKAVKAAGNTIVFATAAMSVAVPAGFCLGFLASSAAWSRDPVRARAFFPTALIRRASPLVYAGSRLLIAAMRSVHELLWAVLLLAAVGLLPIAAVIALSVPFAGVLAKVFSEMIDEAPRDAALALRGAGASSAQIFCLGLLPRALPDMTAYSYYRFECAIRSAAVLGFFGYPTLGYHLAASFENLHYGEVWTYLYTLLLLIAAVEWWSGAVRRRFVV